MQSCADILARFAGNLRIDNADLFHQMPRERFKDKKLCLLSFFGLRAAKIILCNRIPVDLLEVCNIIKKFSISSPGINGAERPSDTVGLRPSYCIKQIGLQMDNGFLTLSVNDIGMVSSVQDV